jgi:thiol-disulfide isomerase/thioredoxin
MKRSVNFLAAFVACLVLAPSRATASDPDVRIVDLTRLDAALTQHRGQGVLLNFWAIWCEPCVAELPELVEIARQFRGRQGVVLTVSYDLMIPGVTGDEVLKQMHAFMAKRKIDLPVLIYDAADYDAINKRFSLPGPVPVTLAIDRSGTIVDRHEGRAGKSRLVAMMRKALGQ